MALSCTWIGPAEAIFRPAIALHFSGNALSHMMPVKRGKGPERALAERSRRKPRDASVIASPAWVGDFNEDSVKERCLSYKLSCLLDPSYRKQSLFRRYITSPSLMERIVLWQENNPLADRRDDGRFASNDMELLMRAA